MSLTDEVNNQLTFEDWDLSASGMETVFSRGWVVSAGLSCGWREIDKWWKGTVLQLHHTP